MIISSWPTETTVGKYRVATLAIVAHSESAHDVGMTSLDDWVMATGFSSWYFSVHGVSLGGNVMYSNHKKRKSVENRA